MKWFNNLKVSMKVLLSSMVFLILIIIISVQGILSNNNASADFKTLYEDRFVPVRQLNILFKGLLQVRINMLQEKIAAEFKDWAEFEKRLKSSSDIHTKNAKIWEDYMKTKLTVKEEKLAKAFNKEYEDLKKIAKVFVSYLRQGKIKESGKISDQWVQRYRVAKKLMDDNMQLQQNIAEKLEKEVMHGAERTLIISLVILAIAIAMVIIITIILSRAVSVPANKGLEFAQKLADGDFTDRIDLDQTDEMGQLGQALNKAADNLEDLISNVIMASQNLAQAVEQIAQGNQNLSQRTSEQASSLEEIASTIEETTATVNQNADNANNAMTVSSESSTLAGDGGEMVNDAVLSINEINATSQKIGEIITVINEISFQTNLLALNAAVEAARAGEQGRGFAVVAGEVRNLAQRSGNAAKEIGDLIKDSINKIEIGTEKANKSGEALKEIIKSVEQVNRVIQEIAAASSEQKQGMSQINVAVTEMDSMTQQNASLVEETASASEEMSNQAQELLEMMGQFKIDEAKVNMKKRQSQKSVHMISSARTETGDASKAKEPETESKVQPQAAKQAGEGKKGAIDDLMADDGFEKF
jgi:methyl-accepting chemotaxis protein